MLFLAEQHDTAGSRLSRLSDNTLKCEKYQTDGRFTAVENGSKCMVIVKIAYFDNNPKKMGVFLPQIHFDFENNPLNIENTGLLMKFDTENTRVRT